MILKRLVALALAGALSVGCALAQTSPLTIAKGGTGGATASAARTSLGLAIGTNVQAYDADLAAIAGLTTAADKCQYWSGAATAALIDCKSWARSFIAAADASAGRTSIGLAIGTDVQAFDADLSALAANSTDGFWAHTGAGTGAARTLTAPAAGFTITNPAGIAGNPTFVLANDLAAIEALSSTGYGVRTTTDTWAQRTFQSGTGLTVTNGDGVSGNTSYAVTDAELLAIAGLTSAADTCLYFTGSGTASTLQCLSWARSFISAATVSAGRTSLGVAIGTDVQAYHAALAALSATIADDQVFVGSGSNAGSWKTVPDCTDTAGNHLNYTQSTNTFSCGTSSSGGGAGVDTQTYLDIMLNSMTGARNAALAQFHGYTFADSFGATTYVNTGAATNLDSATAGLLKPTATDTLSTFAGYTNGGLTISTDHDQVGAEAWKAADKNNATYWQPAAALPAYFKIDFGAANAKIITVYTVRANIAGGFYPTAWILAGSNDDSAYTTVDSQSGLTFSASELKTFTIAASGTPASYRYYRLTISAGSSTSPTTGEITLLQPNNLTVQSTSIAVPANPATCVVYARVKHVSSATVGTDYNLYVSRDGGTTFSSAASLTDYFTDPTDSAHVLYSAAVDVSGQPSGANVQLKLITANNKAVELRDWGFRCAA